MGACASTALRTPQNRRFRRAIKLYEVEEVQSMTNLFNRNKMFDTGESPLTLAAKEGHEAVVEALVNHGADCNQLDLHGRAPLHIAVYINDEETVDILLSAKANANKYDGFGMTPLHIACDRGLDKMVKKLLEAGSEPSADKRGISPIVHAVANAHPLCVDMLLSYNADPNSVDTKGNSLLHTAIANSDEETTEILLKYGANPHIENSTGTLDNLLSLAALTPCPGIVKLLLDVGCNPNIYDKNEDVPPLVAATAKFCPESVELLLSGGADPNIVDKRGHSPLYTATMTAVDLFREAYYCKFFSNVYRSHARFDNIQINPENAIKCAMSLVQGGSDLDPVWGKFCQIFPHPSGVTFEQMVLAEVLIQAYGFRRISGPRIRNFVVNLLHVKEYGLVKLLFSSGIDPCMEDIYILSICSEETDREMFRWVKRLKSKPRQLKDLCRRRVRTMLSWNVLYLIDFVPIPEVLKHYVCIMDTEFYSQVEDPGSIMNRNEATA